ncbi:MAG TPA: amidase family protein, partial [Trueperaceae bacterium]
MADHDPDLQALLHAFARHAHLGLNPEDQQKLEDYVADVWAMAASLREVEQPGLEGLGHRLPRRTAYANLSAAKPPAAPTGSSGERPHEQTPRRAPADAHEWSLEQAANALRSGAITPVDLTAAMLERIRHHDRAVRSYITVAEERALADAQCLTQELERHGPRSALHGIPIGIKDNIPAEGMPCTYNSRLAETWLPKRDAEAVRRLRSAGAVILGKHNLNEFG